MNRTLVICAAGFLGSHLCELLVDAVFLRKLLNFPIFVDGRNLYDPEVMSSAGVNFYTSGRGFNSSFI